MTENTHLTTDNIPLYFTRGETIRDKYYQFIDEELIKGKSIVINKAGMMFLYMSDDHRKDVPQQIIVKSLNNYEMMFLSTDCKRAITLTNL